MNLTRVELQAPIDDPYGPIFPPSGGFTPEWWQPELVGSEDSTYISFLLGSDEVVRVHLDHTVSFDDYVGVPKLQRPALEIQLFETHEQRRRQGFGRAAVDLLSHQHGGRTLVAFSEEADEFWESLGWTRFLHEEAAERPKHFRPLFIDLTGDRE